MKTLLFFLFTCLLTTGCLMGALYASRPLYCYGAAAAAIFLFARYAIHRRQRREQARRQMEDFFLAQFRRSKR